MKPVRHAALALLTLLFGVNCYRAATQSLTHDEALTWAIYLQGPAARIFEVYDANHHFLGTLLEKLTSLVFGFSELSLRLPALLAGAGYFATAYRLSLFVFGDGLLFLLSVALLSCHPLVLDFLVAARGYGLALAFFLWGLLELVKYFCEQQAAARQRRRRLLAAACGFVLAIFANLTLVFPVLALTVLLLAIPPGLHREPLRAPGAAAKPPRSHKKGQSGAAPRLTAKPPGRFGWFVLPLAGGVLLMFLTMPLSQARAGHFYAGVGSLPESLRGLVRLTLAHHGGPLGLKLDGWVSVGMWAALAAVAAALALGVMALRRWRRGGTPPDRVELTLLLAAGTSAGALLLLAAAHHGVGFPYPMDRTGLYFLPLAALCLAGLGRAPGASVRLPMVRVAHLLVLAGVALLFALQGNTTHFQAWRYDADTREIFRRIEADSRGREGPVRVGASWHLEPALNYYRVQGAWRRIEPISRQGPDGAYDYYVLWSADRELIARRNLRVVWEGPVSGAILAVPPGR